MRRALGWKVLVIAMIVALLVVAACAKATPTPTPTPKPTATPTKMAAATPTPVPAGQQTGSVTLAARTVYTVMGDPATAPYLGQGVPAQLGIRDRLFRYIDGEPMGPFLAESWAISPDGNTVTIKIKKSIPFINPQLPATQGMDFGEFTAEDAVWTINRHNASTNPDTTAGDSGQLATYFEEAKVVDQYTFELPMVQKVYFALPLSEMNVLDAGTVMECKSAFDQLGPDNIKDVVVGTGPFHLKEWIANERVVVEANPTNWLKAASIKTFTVIQVQETASRVAMLESGQATAAEMDFSKVKSLREKGLDFMPTQADYDTENASVIWPGNLWETVHARTGEALEPWNAPSYEQDYPWIGNPWGDKVPYTDTDNPSGMSDMEQARLVRWALSYAIDREGIVEQLQGGLGSPIYIEYMGPLYPGWDPNRTVTAAQTQAILEKHDCTGDDCKTYGEETALPDKAWPWEIPYDPDYAEELLDLAGYPMKNGVRFEIKLNKYACETGEVCLEQADAVGAGWEAIGVRTDLLTEDYGAVVSPKMRTREQYWPVVKNCSVESANNPLDWPMPPADSSHTRPGWGCGFEDLFSANMQTKIGSEPNKSTREDWHMDVTDWMFYWQLYNGVAQQPRGVAVDPAKIESWRSPSTQDVAWHRPEFIVLK